MLSELYDFGEDNLDFDICSTCDGEGGWDIGDCEIWDEWIDCQDCDGTGTDLGERFIPERDALRVGRD